MGSWTGDGPIVTGSCSTAAWTLFDLSTAYLWAPVIGCLPDKVDCCPSSYVFASMTESPPSFKTEAISVPTSSAALDSSATLLLNNTSLPVPTGPPVGIPNDVPAATATDVVGCGGDNQALCFNPLEVDQPPGAMLLAARDDNATPNAVSRCPQDYSTVGGTGCCPLGMTATSTLGIIPACATKLSSPFPAPRVQVTGVVTGHNPSSDKPIETATDAIYALQYQIYTLEYKPDSTDDGGLSTGAKAGIGAGVGFIAVVIIGVVVFFLQRRRRRRRIKSEGEGISDGGAGKAPASIGGTLAYYDGLTASEKKDHEPVVGGRAELDIRDAQMNAQSYELPATPLPASEVLYVAQTPLAPGQHPGEQYQYQQQQQQRQEPQYGGPYQAHY